MRIDTNRTDEKADTIFGNVSSGECFVCADADSGHFNQVFLKSTIAGVAGLACRMADGVSFSLDNMLKVIHLPGARLVIPPYTIPEGLVPCMSILITADEARTAIQNSRIMNATGGISDARSHVLSLQSNAHADKSIKLIVQHLESAQSILQGLQRNGVI